MEFYIYDTDLEIQGILENVTAASWTEKSTEAGVFELWCPVSSSNLSLLQENYFVYPNISYTSVGIIEYINVESQSTYEYLIHVKGRMALALMDFRVIYPTFNFTGKLGKLLTTLVATYCSNPADSNRKIPYLQVTQSVLSSDTLYYQQTGNTVLEELTGFSEAYNLLLRVKFNAEFKTLWLQIYDGVDHSINQEDNNPVVFSSTMDSLTDSSYTHNISDSCNIAYVAGEDPESGSSRSYVIVTSPYVTAVPKGMLRRELFVDARDLQSDDIEDGGDYTDLLVSRGVNKLEDYKATEDFSATLAPRQDYKFGEDFDLGDTVTVFDANTRRQLDAVVTSFTITYDAGVETLSYTFGYGQPTITEKLRRRYR